MKSRYMRLFKKQKGFTLIELLAVILILGIIALIAIPSVNSVIEQSKKGAIEQSVIAISKAAEDKCTLDLERDNKHYTIADGNVSPDLPIKNLPDSGEITVDRSCNVKAVACDSSYCAHFDNSSGKVKVVKNKGDNNILASYIDDTDPNCFIFDESSRTITGYHYDNESCPMRIKIPATINNTPVEYIGDEAFVIIPEYDHIVYSGRNKMGEIEDLLQTADYQFSYDTIYKNAIDVYTDFESARDLYDLYKTYYKDKDSTGLQKQCRHLSDYSSDIKPLSYILNKNEYASCSVSSSHSTYVFVSGNIEAVDFTEAKHLKRIGLGAFQNNKIQTVLFDESLPLEEIGNNAFSDNLISGELDFSNSNITTIGSYAFSSNNISSVKLPNKLTNFGNYAFSNNKIEKVNLSSKIEMLSDQFIRNNIKVLNIPNNIRYLVATGWGYENQIEEVNFHNNLEVIGVAFFYHTNLKKVILPKSLKYLGFDAFMSCSNLEEFEFNGNIDIFTSTITFAKKLKKLVINEGVKSIGDHALEALGSESPISIIIPNSVTYIGPAAFGYSRDLIVDKIVIGDNVETISDSAFEGIAASEIILGKKVNYIGRHAFTAPFNRMSTKALVIPDSVKYIGAYAFDNRYFESIYISNGVENVSVYMLDFNNEDAQVCSYPITIDKLNYSLYGSEFGFNNPYAIVTYTDNQNDYVKNGNKFKDGTGIYFNPETGKKCTKAEANNTTGNTSGCMKWYVFGDDGGTNINLLLNHNITSSTLAWNSSGNNTAGPSEAFLSQLKDLTSNWNGVQTRNDSYTVNNGTASYTIDYSGYKARLLTTNELVKIVGISYNVDKSNSTYFITSGTSTADYSYTNGLGWVLDNLCSDSVNGSLINRSCSNVKGYWLATAVGSTSNRAWTVYNTGEQRRWSPSDANVFGIRPVITIPRSLIR